MEETIEVTLTQEDLDSQSGYFSENCLLKVALRRMFPFEALTVAGTYVRFGMTEYKISTQGVVVRMLIGEMDAPQTIILTRVDK